MKMEQKKKQTPQTDMRKGVYPQPKVVSVSTPYSYLPYGLPSEFSKSVLSPENSFLKPRKIFSEESEKKETDDEILIEDVLEDNSDDLLEEVCIVNNQDDNQSFLGVGLTNPLQF